jgi:hypothetical protein
MTAISLYLSTPRWSIDFVKAGEERMLMKTHLRIFRQGKRLALLMVAGLVLLLAGGFNDSAFGQSSGEVSGAITVSDGKTSKTIKLKYAYALSTHGLYLTDKPLPEDPSLWSKYMEIMARDGKLNGMYLMSFDLGQKVINPKVGATARIYCADCDCKNSSGFWIDLHTNATLERTLVNQQMNGRAFAPTFSTYCNEEKQLTAEFDIKFKARPVGDIFGESVTTEDKPGMAYAQFYKAVMAEDTKAVKRFMASEHARFFEGARGQKNITRLKSLIQSFSRVWMTQFFLGDKYAELGVEEEKQGIEPRPKNQFRTRLGSTPSAAPTPPPPPPPPPSRVSKAGPPPGRPGKAPSRVKGGVPTSPRPVGNFAQVLMTFEGGEWKVDWWRLGHEAINLISHIETFKTREEAEAEEAEAYWKIDDAEPLSIGGGDAGKAYIAYCQTEKAGNKKAMLKYLTGPQHDLYAQPGLTIKPGATIWKEGSALQYLNIEVIGGKANDEEALLEVQAMRGGKRITGRVMMILEEDQWKVDREDWQTGEAPKR